MTAKEKIVMDLIREDPRISQEQLAQKSGMSRAAVSVHISNLMKKGYISGRGYILDENPYILIFGAATTDLLGIPDESLNWSDSNPGNIYVTPGGVGRNIAENLARMGLDAKLLSIFGDDMLSDFVKTETKEAGVDLQHSLFQSNTRQGLYLGLMNTDGTMELGVSDIAAMENFPLAHIKEKKHVFARAQLIALDCNIGEAAMEAALEVSTGKIYIDAVSARKAVRAKPFLGRFDTLKLNRLEAAALSGMKTDTESDLKRVADCFLATGVRRVILMLGNEGLYWKNREQEGFLPDAPLQSINTTGADASFLAGLLYADFHGISDEQSLHLAQYAARLTSQSPLSVSHNITAARMKQALKEQRSLEKN